MIKFIKENNSGFSMIEILISLTVFLVGVLGTAKLYYSSLQGLMTSRVIIKATYIASDRLEKLRGTNWDEIKNGTETESDGQKVYNIQTNVTDNQIVPNSRTVAIAVSYTEKSGLTRTITVQTVIPRIT